VFQAGAHWIFGYAPEDPGGKKDADLCQDSREWPMVSRKLPEYADILHGASV
jgi:hypothetical protein